MKKRRPLLADEFITAARDAHYIREMCATPEKTFRHVADLLLKAKRFVLDDDASRFVGEMERASPAAICYGQEFAIQPFDLMYVELNAREMFQAVTASMGDWDADERLGFLYDHGTVYTIVDSRHDPLPTMHPVIYRLHKPMSIAAEQELCNLCRIDRMQLDAYLWGSLFEGIDDDEKRLFRANHTAKIIVKDEIHETLLPRVAEGLLRSSSGDLRNMVALLMFLNRTSGVQVKRMVPAQPAIIRRKPSSMVAHEVISLNLRPTPKHYEAWTAGGAWRRRHDVRGHFCHDDRARNSWCPTHDWSEYEPHRWRCMKCAGKRWWRREHKRGHEDKGITKTTYEVHA